MKDIKHHQIIFKMPIKNQNEQYLNYYKLLYSDKNVHLKYLLFELNFDDNLQKESICYNIYVLEHTILACLRQHVNKKVKMSIYEEMVQKNLQHSNQTMYLKISGVWEDTTYIGLVYKLYYTMSTVKFSNMIC